ncbi:MAG: hypothetical protein Ct9H300mP15_19480 [Gemmatimonadota bacterium]|nr:MAG: hypothetical protein Ct9H300mP15_19480 [Gemmatimonadota bacterium]
MDEEQILEMLRFFQLGTAGGGRICSTNAEGVEIAAVELSEPLLDVRITSLDDQGDPALTGSLIGDLGIQALRRDRISRRFFSRNCRECASDSLPLVSPTARSASRAGVGVYSLEGPDPVAAEEMARYAFEYGYTRIAVLHSQSSGSVQEANAFEEMSRALGLPVVGRYAYQVGATSFGEEIIGAQNALRAAEIAALGLEEDDTLDVELLEPVALFVPIPSGGCGVRGTASGSLRIRYTSY